MSNSERIQAVMVTVLSESLATDGYVDSGNIASELILGEVYMNEESY